MRKALKSDAITRSVGPWRLSSYYYLNHPLNLKALRATILLYYCKEGTQVYLEKIDTIRTHYGKVLSGMLISFASFLLKTKLPIGLWYTVILREHVVYSVQIMPAGTCYDITISSLILRTLDITSPPEIDVSAYATINVKLHLKLLSVRVWVWICTYWSAIGCRVRRLQSSVCSCLYEVKMITIAHRIAHRVTPAGCPRQPTKFPFLDQSTERWLNPEITAYGTPVVDWYNQFEVYNKNVAYSC